MPLSITALASWCAGDPWITGLPIDEAVPMLFRLGPDTRNIDAFLSHRNITEPLCAGSVTGIVAASSTIRLA